MIFWNQGVPYQAKLDADLCTYVELESPFFALEWIFVLTESIKTLVLGAVIFLVLRFEFETLLFL